MILLTVDLAITSLILQVELMTTFHTMDMEDWRLPAWLVRKTQFKSKDKFLESWLTYHVVPAN